MAHLFFIDSIDKLVIRKDSSLLFALTLQKKGQDVYVFFEDNFYINNFNEGGISVYSFKASFEKESVYLKDFKLNKKETFVISENDVIHMRLDPPFDNRYLRYLWMLNFISKRTGADVLNNPLGILSNNEKILAYEQEKSLDSFVGSSKEGFLDFLNFSLKNKISDIILKPLDLYQGIGVEKISISESNKDEVLTVFSKKVTSFGGAIIAQPFDQEVIKGEVRSLYFDGKELGSILKVPPAGEYLANIAQGASYQAYSLSDDQKNICDLIAENLLKEKIRFIAFDLLGNNVSEVNITCPGLLVEVSCAHKKNLAEEMAQCLF